MKDQFYWIGSIIVILVVLGYYTLMQSDVSVNYDELAQCLTESGTKMYGAFWCGHCNAQKEAFGKSWNYVKYIECSTETGQQNQVCAEAGIEGYPTWEFGDGSRLSGKLSFEKLKSKSGC